LARRDTPSIRIPRISIKARFKLITTSLFANCVLNPSRKGKYLSTAVNSLLRRGKKITIMLVLYWAHNRYEKITVMNRESVERLKQLVEKTLEDENLTPGQRQEALLTILSNSTRLYMEMIRLNLKLKTLPTTNPAVVTKSPENVVM
jgi:hypothetical protein